MNFYRAYLRTLFLRPALAVEALYWHLSGRKVRARNRLRIATAQGPHAYATWMKEVERQDEVIAAAGEIMPAWPHRPSFSMVYHLTPRAARHSERVLAGLTAQIYPDFELIIVKAPGIVPTNLPDVPRLTILPGDAASAGQALAMGIAAASGELVIPLRGDGLLPPTALFHYAQAWQASPAAAVFYGDHDEIGAGSAPWRRRRRMRAWFKPRWNAEMFLAQDYISPACAIRTDMARAGLRHPLPAAAATYALLLNIAAQADVRFIHVPHVLAHIDGADGLDDQPARVAAVAHHLADTTATVTAGPFGTVRVDWPLPDPPPLVSIIVPTRDHVKLLRTCVSGVLTATEYPAFELIIVDNGSCQPETLAYLAQVVGDPRVRVLRDDRPFNFSGLNNHAVAQARGGYICLLNNDIEIIDDQWLAALMRQAVRPPIGAAGAKLLYDDGTIQHAGVVIGMGDAAGHAHRYQRNRDAGWFAQAHIARYASAVTAACLVVAKHKFDAVGGLDDGELAVAFNDVDLCLKLEQAGWRNVYVPQAELLHHESKSRGRDFLPANIERYMGELAVLQGRWATATYDDPLHHPHLDRGSENYVLRL